MTEPDQDSERISVEDFEGLDPDEDTEEFISKYFDFVRQREVMEIEEIFREQVHEDFEERFSDGWYFDDVLERRKAHLGRAVELWGDSLVFRKAVRAIDEELVIVTEEYPHYEDLEEEEQDSDRAADW